MTDPIAGFALFLNLGPSARKRTVLGDESDLGFEKILTLRERVIVYCLAEGASQREISRDVFRVDEALISRELRRIREKIQQHQETTRELPIQLEPAAP